MFFIDGRYIHHLNENLDRVIILINGTGGYLGVIWVSRYWLTLLFYCFKETAGFIGTLAHFNPQW